jgi:MFS family permease
MEQKQAGEKKFFGVSRNVFFLGWVSLLTDVSSEMIFTVMPLFLLNVLKVGTPIIGLIEGIAEGTASLLKLVSGWLSDRLGQRKSLAVFGYSFSTLAKPFLYIASSWGVVLAVRFSDRVGKGIRSAPRDALVADSTSPNEMGKSFGFHRAMDTMGAVLGLSLAALIVYLVERGGLELTWHAFRTLVIAGIGPAVLAVLMLLLFVREKKRGAQPKSGDPTAGQAICEGPSKAASDGRFKLFLVIMVLFTLGNSSDAFLILRAQNLGFSVVGVLVLFVTFNLVYALAAMPAGMVSDKLGRKRVIVVGWAIYALSYLGLALASATWQLWLLFALYGLYYGISEGVCRAFVCDLVPVEKRGTAYGWYHTAVGISLLPASVIAGWLWHLIGPSATFYFGAAMAGAAALGFLLLIRER